MTCTSPCATIFAMCRSILPTFGRGALAPRWALTSAPAAVFPCRCGSAANAMGSPRLLLVEDEPALATLLKSYLERLGYQVDACAQADAALALLDAHPEDYALLITDLSLPDMSGDELL